MKQTQNFRNQVNQAYRNARQISMRHIAVSMLIGLAMFGQQAFGFFKNLVTVSDGPFAGLNRGQMRQMSWLFCMYR